MHREQKRRIADEEDPGDTIAGTARQSNSNTTLNFTWQILDFASVKLKCQVKKEASQTDSYFFGKFGLYCDS